MAVMFMDNHVEDALILTRVFAGLWWLTSEEMMSATDWQRVLAVSELSKGRSSRPATCEVEAGGEVLSVLSIDTALSCCCYPRFTSVMSTCEQHVSALQGRLKPVLQACCSGMQCMMGFVHLARKH